MGLVWYGLVLVKQGKFREAAQRNVEALQLDPLSPIINVYVGFDALRWGDPERAKSSFAAAVEIDPDFPVSHYGLARTHALVREFEDALREIGEAIRCAPGRAYYHAQRSLILLQTGDTETAARSVEEACDLSPDNPFDGDLVVAHFMARGDRAALTRIADGGTRRHYAACQRAQALLALGDHDGAHRLYETAELDPEQELMDLVTDDWVWRLPHVINLAHLRLASGDPRGAEELERLLADLEGLAQQGVSSPLARYWAASASSLLGRHAQARELLAEARAIGWNHEWWERLDWNVRSLIFD
jgi:tetratricopeptide (TPR) repeat protein